MKQLFWNDFETYEEYEEYLDECDYWANLERDERDLPDEYR
jgi:hypothetical protein